MRSSLFIVPTIILFLTGAAATAEAAHDYQAPAQYNVLTGQNGGTATGGPVGGLPDRN